MSDGISLATKSEADQLACISLIDRLCELNGSSVTIYGGNGLSELPPYCIEVSDDWTLNEPREFRGTTLLECLTNALSARGRYRKRMCL